jgi:hypothetical protein
VPDEPVGGAGAGAGSGGGSGGGSSSPGVGGTSMTEAQVSAPGGDVDFLNAPQAEPAKTDDAAATKTDAAKAAEETGTEEVNLAALEEGQPEWLAKITDEGAKTEVKKLLDAQKAFSEKFKDVADLESFFKELPGGREQVAALQTLSKEVGELDAALEANTPEGNATVAERYLGMTPDGGVGLLRAAAQHMAKESPENWNQISTELVNSTLTANGVGTDIQGVVGAIAEMRAAVEADDGDAFGKAAAKLLGAPKAAAKTDPKLAQLSERETSAKATAQKAQTETWQMRNDKSGTALDSHLTKSTNEALDKVLPKSVSEKDRATLRGDIASEVMSQIVSDAWLASQVKQLIGFSNKTDKGHDYSKAILTADQAAWDKATEIIKNYATPKLIAKAVAKVVSKWSRDRAASNKDARDKAKGGATTVDVGAAKAAAGNTRKVLTAEQMRARDENGNFKISDQDFLNS